MIYREQFKYDILSYFRLPQGNLPLKLAPLYTENRRENAVVNSMDKSPFIYYLSYSLGHGYYNCWVHIEYLSLCIEETLFFFI